MLSVFRFGAALYFAVGVCSWQHVFSESKSDTCHESCFTTDVGAFDIVKSPIWFSTSPRDSFERSKMSAMNDTAWEHWYFEAFSEAGDLLVTSFARDPSYKLFGQGITRMELRFAWANGSSFAMVETIEKTMVQDCCGEVFGSWTGAGKACTFRISADLKTAAIEFRTPEVEGTVELKSFGPSRYPNGDPWPSTTASTQLIPYLHFTESIIAARAKVDLKVHGSQLKFHGSGGHNHIWAAFDWFTAVQGWRLSRGVVGPYAFSLFHPISKVDAGVEYQSAILLKDGKSVFSASGPLNRTSLPTTNHAIIGQSYGGVVKSKFLEHSSGWTLDFVAPATGEKWHFNLEHTSVPMDIQLGAASSASYFIDKVTGGEVGGEQYTGYSLGEQTFFPETLGLDFMYRVWTYFLQETRATVLGSLWSTTLAIAAEGRRFLAWKMV